MKNPDSITVKRDPSSSYELVIKKYVDNSVGDGTKVRFNRTLQIFLKVSVGIDTYNLTKNDKTQITDRTIIKTGNSGNYMLPRWKPI